MRCGVHASIVVLLTTVAAAGCATGGIGSQDSGRSNPDGGPSRDVPSPVDDAGTGDSGGGGECTPPCREGDVCVEGRCRSGSEDGDGDGVPASMDCDDTDADVGSTAERACSTECGDGTETCVDGSWGSCSAPTDCSCDCDPGSTEMDTNPCGACGEGMQVRTRECDADCTWGSWGAWSACMTSAECSPGDTDTDTRSCTGSCGGEESRTRSCDSATCTWGSWSGWSGCPSSCCGDGTCGGGETCSSCEDCQAGHLGTGSHGDPCPAYADEQWRCVNPGSGGVSQVCRNGSWVSFNTNVLDCAACVCSFSASACCAPGSPSDGC